MSGVPVWRRFAPRSTAARLIAVATFAAAGLLTFALLFVPLQSRLAEARALAVSLDKRTAALEAATEARLEEAAFTLPNEESLRQSTNWLDEHAPERAEGEAMLELLSTLRLLATAAGVQLTSVTALDAGRDAAARDIAAQARAAGLVATIAEARIVAEHETLAAFLKSLDEIRPTLRAAALDITSRTGAATAEARRLSVRVVVGALSRPAKR